MKINFENSLILLKLNNKYNSNNITDLTQEELKKSYHIMALNLHPDKNLNDSINTHINKHLMTINQM